MKDLELVPASPRAAFQINRALACKKNLLLYVDEEKGGYVWAPSLGRELPYAGNRWMAARLAVRHEIDIVPVYVEQVAEARYRIVIEAKLQRGGGTETSRARSLADQLEQRLDEWIRARLEQWYWLPSLALDKPLPKRAPARR